MLPTRRNWRFLDAKVFDSEASQPQAAPGSPGSLAMRQDRVRFIFWEASDEMVCDMCGVKRGASSRAMNFHFSEMDMVRRINLDLSNIFSPFAHLIFLSHRTIT